MKLVECNQAAVFWPINRTGHSSEVFGEERKRETDRKREREGEGERVLPRGRGGGGFQHEANQLSVDSSNQTAD